MISKAFNIKTRAIREINKLINIAKTLRLIHCQNHHALFYENITHASPAGQMKQIIKKQSKTSIND